MAPKLPGAGISATEKLKVKSLGGRQIGKLTETLLAALRPADLPENLPVTIVSKLKLMPRYEAYRNIHFPSSPEITNRLCDG